MATLPRYNLDLTGVNVNNRVVDEPHLLTVKQFRSVAPIYGPYYTESLIVTDMSTQQVLIRDIHYKCVDVVGIATAQSGKEICTILVITSTGVGSQIKLTYQALGGGYERTNEAIKTLVDNLLIDNRPATWPGIINRPDGFTPSHHLHRVGDVIGFEYLVAELERLKNAILLGDEIAHNEILSYAQAQINALGAILSNAENLTVLVGVTAATSANAAAATALQTVSNIVSNDLTQINASLTAANAVVDVLSTDHMTSENRAITLIQTYG